MVMRILSEMLAKIKRRITGKAQIYEGVISTYEVVAGRDADKAINEAIRRLG